MSDGVYMDPVELRRVAERILGDREFDYRPKLDELKKQLTTESSDDLGEATSDQAAGFLYGRSGIGAYHDKCVQDVIKLLDSVDLGFVAMSNVLASVAEDYVKTDGDAGTDLSNTLPYFNPATTSGPVEYIDPGTGIISYQNPSTDPTQS